MHNKLKSAFSLIEISIVILIIGVLVIGITKGTRIIRASRLASARALSKSSPVNLNSNEIALWFDATNEKSFKANETVNGTTITTWYDVNPVSSSPLDLVNSSGPTYMQSSANGLPGVKFNNTPLSRNNVYGKDLTKGNQITTFIVQKHYGTPSNNFASPVWWGDANEIILMHVLSDSDVLISDFGVCCGGDARMAFVPTPSAAAFEDRTNIIVSTRRPNGVGIIRINGYQQYSVPAGTLTSTIPGSTVSSFVMGNDGMKSDINELIIFRSALSDKEIQDIEKYLSTKWGVPLKPLS